MVATTLVVFQHLLDPLGWSMTLTETMKFRKEKQEMTVQIDVVLDISRGDCGKGKVSHYLASTNNYTHSLRFNGGGNAGHTIYHEGKKFVTHQVPSGVFYGIKSVIGNGCAINKDKLFQEIDYLEQGGIDVRKYLRVARNAHVIQPEHLQEDGKDTSIGTTRTGNGPCYRDKYARNGVQAQDCPELEPFLVDMYEEFYYGGDDRLVLAEGAQGFYLDVDWGKYPFVTSSHCGIGSVLLNGFNHKQIRRVYGVAKAYETYVGADKFEPDELIFHEIRKLGQEFGATTGRPRQCNWLHLGELVKAAQMNSVDELILNKIDVLDALRAWKIREVRGRTVSFSSSTEFRTFVADEINKQHPCQVRFSNNPHDIF
jgi:adenylosuccinate synthase